MTLLSNKNSPLGRWLVSTAQMGKSPASTPVLVETSDPVSYAHWIMYGVLPSSEDANYWASRSESNSVYELLQLMHDASPSLVNSSWEKIIQLASISRAQSISSLDSPTLIVLRAYHKAAAPNPGAGRVIRYLRAIIRRPTNYQNFVRHIEYSISRNRRRKTANLGYARVSSRVIPEAVIFSELLMIETLLNSARDGKSMQPLFRALSPIPDLSRRLEKASAAQNETDDVFDNAVRSSGIDLTVLERALRPLLPRYSGSYSEHDLQRIVDIVSRALGSDNPHALVVVLYRLFLGRDPDDEGYAHYVASIASGSITVSDAVNEFLSSKEYASNKS